MILLFFSNSSVLSLFMAKLGVVITFSMSLLGAHVIKIVGIRIFILFLCAAMEHFFTHLIHVTINLITPPYNPVPMISGSRIMADNNSLLLLVAMEGFLRSWLSMEEIFDGYNSKHMLLHVG